MSENKYNNNTTNDNLLRPVLIGASLGGILVVIIWGWHLGWYSAEYRARHREYPQHSQAYAPPAQLAYSNLATPRMSLEQSEAIKRNMVASQHPGHSVREYELDHIIPLCLGGSNDLDNLQLQTWYEASKKDDLEYFACSQVWHGRISVEIARDWFKDWKISYIRIFGRKP